MSPGSWGGGAGMGGSGMMPGMTPPGGSMSFRIGDRGSMTPGAIPVPGSYTIPGAGMTPGEVRPLQAG